MDCVVNNMNYHLWIYGNFILEIRMHKMNILLFYWEEIYEAREGRLKKNMFHFLLRGLNLRHCHWLPKCLVAPLWSILAFPNNSWSFPVSFPRWVEHQLRLWILRSNVKWDIYTDEESDTQRGSATKAALQRISCCYFEFSYTSLLSR